MEKNDPWADLGITGETRFLNLLFDQHSASLVAQYGRSVAENVGIKSLYLRNVKDQAYRRLSPVNERLSYEDVVLSPEGPYLFVNIMELLIDDTGAAGDWHALQKIELPSGKVVLEIHSNELEPRSPGLRVWISRIVGVSSDGREIFCTVGIQKGTDRVHYHLVSLYPDQKRYELITEFTHVCL